MKTLRPLAVFALVLCTLPAGLLAAQKGGEVYEESVSRDGLPCRILLGISADPRTSQPVTWRAVGGQGDPAAQIAPCSADPGFVSSARTVPASVVETTVLNGPPVRSCEAFLNELEPGRKYACRVGTPGCWSEWFQFETAADAAGSFRFLYFGDMQNDLYSLCGRTVRAGRRAAPDARFMVFAGDLVAEGYDDSLWAQWHHALSGAGIEFPVMACPGNHDEHIPPDDPRGEVVLGVGALWRSTFSFPKNGPENSETLSEAAWYTDYQGARFVFIDSNPHANDEFAEELRGPAVEAQAAWLDRVLGDPAPAWRIVVQHHPVYSVGKDRDSSELREALVPVYEKHGVDLVLQGHDHRYGRTHKVRGGQVVAPEERGVVYAVSVAGRKMYPKNPKFEGLMAVLRGDEQCFQVVSVSPEAIRYEARNVAGDLVDRFSIVRGGNGTTLTQD